MEDRVVVIPIYAMLQEISTCEWALLGPEFEGDVAGGGAENTRRGRLGLEIIDGRHVNGLGLRANKPK